MESFLLQPLINKKPVDRSNQPTQYVAYKPTRKYKSKY
jgi:hypothetical protein